MQQNELSFRFDIDLPISPGLPVKHSTDESNICHESYIGSILDQNGVDMNDLSYDLDFTDEPLVQLKPNAKDEQSKTNNPTKIEAKQDEKGLGVWSFDPFRKQRVYISLTGKRLTGPHAVKQSKLDKESEAHPSKTSRYELLYLVSLTPGTKEELSIWIREYMQQNHRFLQLSTWGIPARTIQKYHSIGVRSLFQWQTDCLLTDDGNPLLGGNLIYSAPTSGGKTLVSEILMLRRLALRPGTILFVVPFVSLADEKTKYFQDIWSDMFIGVQAFHGESQNNRLTPDVDVAVCTIEKANILINTCLDENKMSQISMIIIDEIHMLSEKNRGFLLEVMLSKVKFLMRQDIQIVGMSATLPNIGDLATWLGASLYITEYRPVNLSTYICYNNTLLRVDTTNDKYAKDSIRPDSISSNQPKTNANEPSGNFEPERTIEAFDDDDLDCCKSLTLESLSNTKSVMVFCSSKRKCESSSLQLASAIYKNHTALLYRESEIYSKQNTDMEIGEDVATSRPSTGSTTTFPSSNKSNLPSPPNVNIVFELTANQNIRTLRKQLMEQLALTSVGICPILARSIPYGVAYHHGGLTAEERDLLENAYRKGTITVLCTTSTLAAGVNLPANRVIIREPRMGIDNLTVAAFRQMCGRAGRTGFDSTGDAVLAVSRNKRNDYSLSCHLVTAQLDPLVSSLHEGTGGGVEKLLLDMISCGKISQEDQILGFIQCTLFATQNPNAVVFEAVQKALQFLRSEQLISEGSLNNTGILMDDAVAGEVKDSKEASSSLGGQRLLFSTQFGRGTSISGITPRDSILILESLSQARKRLVLKGGLHPVFLVTPVNSSIVPNWQLYDRITMDLCQDQPDTWTVMEVLGITMAQLVTYKQNPPPFNLDITSARSLDERNAIQKALHYRRFYCAIILSSVIQEWPITQVIQLMGESLGRGQVQQLQKEASAFCNMVVLFCDTLNWTSLSRCLETFCKRLSFGVRDELLPLVRIGQEMTALRARVLYKKGLKAPIDIINAGNDAITALLMESLPYDYSDPITDRAVSNDNKSKSIAEKRYLACQRLANVIIARAKSAVMETIKDNEK